MVWAIPSLEALFGTRRRWRSAFCVKCVKRQATTLSLPASLESILNLDEIRVLGRLQSPIKALLSVEHSMALVKEKHAGAHQKRFLGIWLSIAKICSRII